MGRKDGIDAMIKLRKDLLILANKNKRISENDCKKILKKGLVDNPIIQ